MILSMFYVNFKQTTPEYFNKLSEKLKVHILTTTKSY